MTEFGSSSVSMDQEGSSFPASPQVGDHDPIDQYLTELAQAVRDMRRDWLWTVTHVLLEAWRNENQIFIVGNGGSAATASHMANDLNKLTITPGQPRFKAIALTDNIPLMTAWGNDSAYEDIFSEQLINFIKPGDVVVAISASGNSPNVLKAVHTARVHGAVTVALTGDTGGKLKAMVDHYVLVPTGHICQQEDCHLILEHAIANTLRALLEREMSS
jgi:D-sedoheptulose 7-phosphate isomerase